MGRRRAAPPPRRELPAPECRRVIELVRCSTQGQASRDTPEIQRRELDELRLDRKGIIVERVEEPGVSGQTELEARLFMARLHANAIAGYDEVRVIAVDRIGRLSSFGIAPLVKLIQDAQAVIFDLSIGRELDPCVPQGEKDLADLCNDARMELERIRYRTIKGRRRRLVDGLAPNGGIPWGISRVERRYLLAEEAHAHLTYACERILAGRSLRKVCVELAERGINGFTGRGWGQNGESLRAAVRDDAYLGRWHGTAGGLTRPIPVAGALDEALVMAARAALESRRKRPSDGRTVEALVRGRVSCGTCSGPMNVAPATGARRYDYYRCPRCIKGANVCHSLERVDERVWGTLKEDVLCDVSLVQALDALARLPPEDDGSVGRIEAELRIKQRSLDGVLRALGDVDSSEHLEGRIRVLNREISDAEARLRAARREREACLNGHRNAAVRREGFLERLAALRRGLDGMNFEGRREVVAMLDVQVVLHADHWADMQTRLSSTALGPPPKPRVRPQFMDAPMTS